MAASARSCGAPGLADEARPALPNRAMPVVWQLAGLGAVSSAVGRVWGRCRVCRRRVRRRWARPGQPAFASLRIPHTHKAPIHNPAQRICGHTRPRRTRHSRNEERGNVASWTILQGFQSTLNHGTRVAGRPAARRPRMIRPTGHAPSSRAGEHSRCHAGGAAPVGKDPRLPRQRPERRRQVRVSSLPVGGLAAAVGHRAHTHA